MEKQRGIKAGALVGVLILLFGLFFGLRGNSTPLRTPEELIGKYEEKQKQFLGLTRYGVGVRETFSYDFAYDFSQDTVSVCDGIITVHTERHCLTESRLVTGVEIEPEKIGCRVKIHPIEQALASKSDRLAEDSWGSAPVYYLAIRYDQKTAEKRKLDQPVIVPFTLKSPCGVPNLKGEKDAEGIFRLRWNPVRGATEYRIYKYYSNQYEDQEEAGSGACSGYHDGSLLYEGSVRQTSYESFSGTGENRVSIQSYKDGEEIVFEQNYGVQGAYYVTAVVDGRESIMSNGVSTAGRRLPCRIADEQDLLYQRYERADELPLSVPVENTDGTVENRRVLYSLYQGTNMMGEKQPHYRYRIEGTSLRGYVVMTGDKEETYPETVGTPSLAGRREPVDELDKVPQVERRHIAGQRKKTAAVPDTDYYIKADDAAEEWLALNLIAGEDQIYIGDFPRLTEPDLLRETFYHVYYQNPYVFGIAAFACDYGQLTLHIEYLYSRSERERMREEMTGEAEKILKEAGLAGQGEKKHSTEETIRILYEWLENHISYDMEAYEDSAAHQYEKAGETYEYAHNAWGILTKRKGMCQGYSDAFLLLCHMAGVEAAAVTGSINQSIPHVWNAVCLEGNWYYVDATNNKRNTGAPPGLYLAGEKQAEENHYVREGKGEFDSGSEIVIARQNFK